MKEPQQQASLWWAFLLARLNSSCSRSLTAYAPNLKLATHCSHRALGFRSGRSSSLLKGSFFPVIVFVSFARCKISEADPSNPVRPGFTEPSPSCRHENPPRADETQSLERPPLPPGPEGGPEPPWRCLRESPGSST